MNAWQRGLLLGLAIVPAGLAAQPALAPLLAPPAALPAVQVVHRAPLVLDTQRSQLGFEVRSRLGQRIEGSFPHFEGRIEVLSDWPYPVVAQLRDSQSYVVMTGLGRSLFDYRSAQVREHQADWEPLLTWLDKA